MQMLQFDEALQNIKKGLSIDPKDTNLRSDLSDCEKLRQQYSEMERAIRGNDFNTANSLINNIIQKVPKNGSLQVKRVIVLAMKGSTD